MYYIIIIKLFLQVENKLNEIKNQIRSMESNLLECAEVTHKIYNKLDNKRDGFELYMKGKS